MAIQRTDVTLKESERLADTDDGGGRRTANEVTSGEVNNLMPDISRLDRTVGRVNLRKAFLHVDTQTRDVYFGAHTILDKPPADPNVSALLFSTGSHSDERLSAQRRIESYVTQGPEAPVRILGDQLEGQRSITVYQRESEPTPEIGEVLVLSVEDSGSPKDGDQQFIRITDVDSEVRTFSESTGSGVVDFEARVVTLRISSELRQEFPGAPARRDFSSGSTVVRSTNVSQAASYFGMAEVTEAVAQGDTQVTVDSVFNQIVPNTQSETPQTDVDAGATVSHEKTSGGETVEVQGTGHTDDIPVTIQSRTLTWTNNLQPLPAPGTTVIEFRALGNWQRIQDRGDGKLTGDGTGTVDYGTGSVEVTLAALPDVGTSVLYSWGTPTHYTDRADTSASIDPPIAELVPDQDVAPGSLAVTWTDSNDNTLTANDDGAGAITGDATGRVIYSGEDRIIRLQPDTMPGSSTQYQLDYDEAARVLDSEPMSNVISSGSVSFTLGTTPVKKGSVAITVPMERLRNSGNGPARGARTRVVKVQVTDDTVGNLVLPDGTQIGTVDYSTGDITFDSRRSYERRIWVQTGSGENVTIGG